MARTINSPGVEIKEYDLSETSSIQAGTNVLVQGFAPQGPTNELIQITTITELRDVYFGGNGPTNAAERYFYHSCVEVLGTSGTLWAVRLPYGADTGDGFNGKYVALAFGGTSVSAASGTTLTLNPSAFAVALTEEQYESIQEGALTYETPTSSISGVEWADVLEHSAFFVVNKMQSDIDANYQGFYITIADQTPYVSLANDDQETAYGAIDAIGYVGSTSDVTSASSIVTTSDLPSSTLGFSLTGENSLSYDMVNAPTFSFDESEFQNCIAIGVHRMARYATSSDPSKLLYNKKEFITGSFDTDATRTNSITLGTEEYAIDKQVDGNSSYVKLFLNDKFKYAANKPDVVKFSGDNHAICYSLGASSPCVEADSSKYIGKIPGKISNALLLIDNPLNQDLDIVVDGGLSTIWAYVSYATLSGSVSNGAAQFDDTVYISDDAGKPMAQLKSDTDYASSPFYTAHRTVFNTFNTFCKETRKDCIFISDPLRSIFVRGADKKIMDIKSKIFSTDVVRMMKSLYSGSNSNFGCTYANWVKKWDDDSGQYVWLPMSPFEAAVMCKLDSNYYPWFAPFGLNNGILSTIVDIAIRPNQQQCDSFYKMGINPVCYFKGDGFAVWGQKTLQTKASAFDRINVRRLFLTLERSTMKAMRYFIGEPNTTFTRTRVGNVLTPVFNVALNNQGVYDYRIVCNEKNNTPDVIDANEMSVKIYLKPVKTAEFILVDFYATKTSANFDELIG